MTISTTASSVTAQGNGTNTNWPFAFLIPNSASLVVTLTLISDGSTQVLDSSTYSVAGLNDPNGGTVSYPLIGSPLSSLYNITVERMLPLTQEVDLVNQDNFYPEIVEGGFDTLAMQIQQVQAEIDRSLLFPVGATDTPISVLITDILNGAANATAAAASAAAAAASAATILAQFPVVTANIANQAVTTAKIAGNAVIPSNLDTASVPAVFMLNGILVPTVAANALTITLQTFAGNDPSSTDPVYVIFRNSAKANGGYSVITVTAATSLTVPAGATLNFANGVAARFWVVAFNDGGTFRLGVINCLDSNRIYPLGGIKRASSTAVDATSSSSWVFYTRTAVSSKAFTILGYMEWESGLATAGVWSAAPTIAQLMDRNVPFPGSVIGVTSLDTGAFATGTTVLPYDDTIPQKTEGDEYMSLAVVLGSPANLLSIEAVGLLSPSTAAVVTMAMFQDTATPAIAAVAGSGLDSDCILSLELKKRLQANAASTTIKIRAGLSTAGTTTFNGAGGSRRFGGLANSYLEVSELMI